MDNYLNKTLLTALLLTLTFFFSVSAFAEELVWQNIQVSGGGSQVGCNSNSIAQDIFWNSYGGDISFVFTKLGITLERGGFSNFKMSASTSCTIDASVTIPRGFYVASIAQALIGGIVKDRGAIAGITSNAFLFTNQIPLNQINIYSAADLAIDATAGLLVRNNTQILDALSKRIQCATTLTQPLTTNFRLNIAAVATRLLPFQRVVINLDANDLTYQLTPSLLPCGSGL